MDSSTQGVGVCYAHSVTITGCDEKRSHAGSLAQVPRVWHGVARGTSKRSSQPRALRNVPVKRLRTANDSSRWVNIRPLGVHRQWTLLPDVS